jgi:hypothetical protein
MAFDRWGNLWVTGVSAGLVYEYAKWQLARSGSPTPVTTISDFPGGPGGLAFDPSGDMWDVTGGGPDCYGTPCNNELVELTKAQLSQSGSPTPAVTISSNVPGCSTNPAPSTCAAGSLYGPYGVAVDRSGDMWVSNFNTPTTVEFGSDQLYRSRSPSPVRTIAGPDTGMNWPSFVTIAP